MKLADQEPHYFWSIWWVHIDTVLELHLDGLEIRNPHTSVFTFSKQAFNESLDFYNRS